MTTLIERVNALPPELYNEIFQLTFTAFSNKAVYIDKAYRPPRALQVSRATRFIFEKSYYGHDAVFYIDCRLLKSWLQSLTIDYVSLLGNSHIRMTGIILQVSNHCLQELYHDFIKEYTWYLPLSLFYGCNLTGALSFKIAFATPEKTTWVSYLHLYRAAEPYLHGTPGSPQAETWCEERHAREADKTTD